ncbi:DUF4397 domain-containing protein [Pedobacter sp. HMF7647]|uniref:DUF4397 domain-containing protein n=1 Tax=Hufsiella arboris TaxID=2695275 RepID=A0A7K1YFQ1_9SPHI|nr:DUF4397 domain-containing protein [Hufsiella arboris]MXV52938.1 DUF4397 domain-containing protein [Hufsiella arboris]
MKTNNAIKKTKFFLAAAALLGAVTFFSSCDKSDDNGYENGSVTVMAVNAREASLPQNFYLDQSKMNGDALAYTQNTAYITSNSGNRTASFRVAATGTVNTSDVVQLQDGKHYTFFYTGDLSNNNLSVALEDDLSAPASGKAKVRFVHLSPAASASVDIAVQNGSKLATNLAYKGATAFSEIDGGTYNLQLSAAGSVTSALSIPNVTIEAGKIYTVYISGSTAATISSHVIVNN